MNNEISIPSIAYVRLFHNHYCPQHLEHVKRQMQVLGAPRIAVVELAPNDYQAVEGCHRLRACAALGILPILRVVTGITDEHTRAHLALDGMAHDETADMLLVDIADSRAEVIRLDYTGVDASEHVEEYPLAPLA